MAMSRLKKGGVAGAVTAVGIAAITLIGTWEGKRNNAYRDVVGVPTICFGETRGVKMGDHKTDAECEEMFVEALVDFEKRMVKCLRDPDAIPDKPYVTFLSLAYNIGTGAFCKSTLVKKLNAGDIVGACNQLPRWNRAGGQVIPGLVNRRKAEQKMCLEGANDIVVADAPAPVPPPKPEPKVEPAPAPKPAPEPPLPPVAEPAPTPAPMPTEPRPPAESKPSGLGVLVMLGMVAGFITLVIVRKRRKKRGKR